VNAELSAEDRFYEWLLSDHPGAAAERARRRLDNQTVEAHDLARLRAWLTKIDSLARDGQPLGDSVWRLAEQARTWLIPSAEQRLTASIGEPDQAWVRRSRHDYETSQQLGKDLDYRYPARYLGAQAARQPIPPDPSMRLHDPEERPSLGERVGKALEEENGSFAFVREHAIRERAHLAQERAQRQRPGRPHPGRQPVRPGRAHSDREEADRER
jgi:hypothetical protein